MDEAAGRRSIPHLLDVLHRMAQRDGVEGRRRCGHPGERCETLILENALDGAQPIRTLRMSGRHNMIEAGRVTDQKG